MKIFRNRTVIGVLCILLALIICFGVTPLFSRSASEKTEIVRVTKDIKEGDEITAEMVQTVEVGAYNLPQNLMTDKKEVVGKYATADLAAGDYILSSKLSAVPAAENAYLYNLDGKKQAISVTIKSFATGLSGKLESGDLARVCGTCDDCEDGCPFDDLEDGMLELPDYLREEAGIPAGAKLCVYVDDEEKTVTIAEAGYDHDLRDVPPYLLEMLGEAGICLGELEEQLMVGNLIYGERTACNGQEEHGDE